MVLGEMRSPCTQSAELCGCVGIQSHSLVRYTLLTGVELADMDMGSPLQPPPAPVHEMPSSPARQMPWAPRHEVTYTSPVAAGSASQLGGGQQFGKLSEVCPASRKL
jgi:hypothetical protein